MTDLTNSPVELLKIATELALAAGDIVREGAAASKFTVAAKSTATDPVTEIDKASEAFIVDELSTRRPHDGLLGEEGASVASSSGVEWIIDPIDGTTNFIYGIPAYAVCIGAAVDGVPVAGAVYNVAINELFTAAQGHGAFLNGQRIGVNDTTDLNMALVATGFAYSAEARTQQSLLISRLAADVRDFRRIGSAALDICNVASGRVDAYFEDGVKPWDVTAASVVLTEAGGTITGFDGNLATKNALAACTPEIYEALRTRINN